MRTLRLALATVVAAAIPLMTAALAHAVLVGKCQASGTVKSTGITYDPKTVNKVTLPLKDDVAWKGSVTSPAGKRAISGKVRVQAPVAAAQGRHRLAGVHVEPGVVCAGAVIVHFKGGGFGNPGVIGTFVLLVISGVALVISFRAKAA